MKATGTIVSLFLSALALTGFSSEIVSVQTNRFGGISSQSYVPTQVVYDAVAHTNMTSEVVTNVVDKWFAVPERELVTGSFTGISSPYEIQVKYQDGKIFDAGVITSPCPMLSGTTLARKGTEDIFMFVEATNAVGEIFGHRLYVERDGEYIPGYFTYYCKNKDGKLKLFDSEILPGGEETNVCSIVLETLEDSRTNFVTARAVKSVLPRAPEYDIPIKSQSFTNFVSTVPGTYVFSCDLNKDEEVLSVCLEDSPLPVSKGIVLFKQNDTDKYLYNSEVVNSGSDHYLYEFMYVLETFTDSGVTYHARELVIAVSKYASGSWVKQSEVVKASELGTHSSVRRVVPQMVVDDLTCVSNNAGLVTARAVNDGLEGVRLYAYDDIVAGEELTPDDAPEYVWEREWKIKVYLDSNHKICGGVSLKCPISYGTDPHDLNTVFRIGDGRFYGYAIKGSGRFYVFGIVDADCDGTLLDLPSKHYSKGEIVLYYNEGTERLYRGLKYIGVADRVSTQVFKELVSSPTNLATAAAIKTYVDESVPYKMMGGTNSLDHIIRAVNLIDDDQALGGVIVGFPDAIYERSRAFAMFIENNADSYGAKLYFPTNVTMLMTDAAVTNDIPVKSKVFMTFRELSTDMFFVERKTIQ